LKKKENLVSEGCEGRRRLEEIEEGKMNMRNTIKDLKYEIKDLKM